MSRVAITSVKRGVDHAFAEAMVLSDCIGVIDSGARVLIKPNWNACGIAGSTSMTAVLAACRWAHSQGAGEVIVGEGPVPVGPERIAAYLKEMRAEERLAEVGARFVLFDADEHVLFRGKADLPEEIGIARLALECDVTINLALMKVHSTCVVTLCLKNLKGCLRPKDKMAFHRTGLLPAIVALNHIVRPQIHVVDAIDGMEGEHTHGDVVHLGLFIAGRDPVAVDTVACAQMGIDAADVPLLRMAAKAGMGTHRRKEIEIAGEALRPRRFERAQERLKRLYPDLSIDDAGACTACQAALMDGLFIARDKRRVTSVALGKDARPGPDTLVIGRCLREYWPTHAHVKGCPPAGTDIADALCREEGGKQE